MVSSAQQSMLALITLLSLSWSGDHLQAQTQASPLPQVLDPASAQPLAPLPEARSTDLESIRQDIRRIRLEMLDVLNDLETLERSLETTPPPLSPLPTPPSPQPSPTEPTTTTELGTTVELDAPWEQTDTPGPEPAPAPGAASPSPSANGDPTSVAPPSLEDITALQAGTQTISLPGDVLFDFDQSEIRPEAALLLQQAANAIIDMTQARIIVAGHTDDVGDEAYNQALSLARANAVKTYLLDLIPDPQNYSWLTKGFGSSQPIAGNTTPQGRQQNRRVDLIIAP